MDLIALERALLLEQVAVLPLAAVVQGLVLAFVLGLVVAMLHRASVPGRLVPSSLVASLALLPVVSALVLMVIGNSLARAFSLVGALAIVRFRTRLRSTWDITFVFLSLAVGIACGVDAVTVAAVGVAVSVLAVGVLGLVPGARPQAGVHVLRCDVASWQVGEAQLLPLLDRHVQRRALSSARTLRFGETLSLSYQLVLKKGTSLEALVREVAAVEGVERVSVLSEDDGGGEE